MGSDFPNNCWAGGAEEGKEHPGKGDILPQTTDADCKEEQALDLGRRANLSLGTWRSGRWRGAARGDPGKAGEGAAERY